MNEKKKRYVEYAVNLSFLSETRETRGKME